MLTPEEIKARKSSGEKISMITAYDFAFAQMAEAAGIDQILVGDSLANTMLGYKSTREIGMEEMLIFVAAVCRGAPNTHVVADMPYRSDKDPQTAYDNAKRFMDLGASSVKLEGTPEGVNEFLRSKDPCVPTWDFCRRPQRTSSRKAKPKKKLPPSRPRRSSSTASDASKWCWNISPKNSERRSLARYRRRQSASAAENLQTDRFS